MKLSLQADSQALAIRPGKWGRNRRRSFRLLFAALGAFVLASGVATANPPKSAPARKAKPAKRAAPAKTKPKAAPEDDAPLLRAGKTAPDFTLAQTDGQKVSLAALLKTNKVVLLNFWGYH